MGIMDRGIMGAFFLSFSNSPLLQNRYMLNAGIKIER